MPAHRGGVVCNNVISSALLPSSSAADFEEGIALWSACVPWVLHNTIASPGGGETLRTIEYRFAGTYVHLANNLALTLPAAREGDPQLDPTYAASNATYGSLADFVDASRDDLRLSSSAMPPAGASIASLGLCETDAAGTPRALDVPTVGAFER